MEKNTRVAIIYDFDKTLGIDDMQCFGLLEEIGYKNPNDFWKLSNSFAKKENMDGTLAFLYTMISEAKKHGVKITRDYLKSKGKDIKYFPGLKNDEYFTRINQYGKERDVDIYHYVISSGNQEIIEGSSIYHNFTKVFGCEYLYNSEGEAIFPKVSINYTNKTQFLFRISKNTYEVSDSIKVNKEIKMEKRFIPFSNIIYIADGTTDIPCLKLVSEKGGTSIAVFPDRTDNDQAKEIFNNGRANFITKADYSEGKELDTILKNIISKIKVEDWLNKKHLQQKEKYSILDEEKD